MPWSARNINHPRILNFGMAAAPTLFGRVPRVAVQPLRRVLRIAIIAFHDVSLHVRAAFRRGLWANRANGDNEWVCPAARSCYVPASPVFIS